MKLPAIHGHGFRFDRRNSEATSAWSLKCHGTNIDHLPRLHFEANRGPIPTGTDWCQSGSDCYTNALYQAISCRYTEEAIGIAYRG